MTSNELLQITEHIPQDGVPQQLDQQQVLAFLQGKCSFHINTYIPEPSLFLVAHALWHMQLHAFLECI